MVSIEYGYFARFVLERIVVTGIALKVEAGRWAGLSNGHRHFPSDTFDEVQAGSREIRIIVRLDPLSALI